MKLMIIGMGGLIIIKWMVTLNAIKLKLEESIIKM
jgi:hypothetical protein